MIGYIISLCFIGLIVGALARLALPGRDPMTILQTMLVGVAGSLAAGIAYALLFHRNGGGFIVSVLFSMAIVYAIRRARGGSLTDPGGRHARGQQRPERAGLFR